MCSRAFFMCFRAFFMCSRAFFMCFRAALGNNVLSSTHFTRFVILSGRLIMSRATFSQLLNLAAASR